MVGRRRWMRPRVTCIRRTCAPLPVTAFGGTAGGNRPKRNAGEHSRQPTQARSEQGSSSMQRAAPREGAGGARVTFFFFSLCDTYIVQDLGISDSKRTGLRKPKATYKGTAFLYPERPRPSLDTRQRQTDTRSVLQGVPIRRTTRRSQGKATLSSGCTRARIGCSSCKRSEPSGGLCRCRAGPPCPARPTLQPRSAENTGITSALIWPAGGMHRSLACVGRVARLLVPATAVPQSQDEGAFGKSVCGLDR